MTELCVCKALLSSAWYFFSDREIKWKEGKEVQWCEGERGGYKREMLVVIRKKKRVHPALLAERGILT